MPLTQEWGLSQRSPNDEKIHPCAFFSRRLSPAERNYDIGNRELLAVKLASEEWRHWLEGAEQPFVVWTDHKNLSYIQTAKRLNSRQARWSLFFGRFNFTLAYRPGSRNIKPDALSRQFYSENRLVLTPSPPLPASRWRLSPGRLSPLSGGPKLQSRIWVTAPRTAFLLLVLPAPKFCCGAIRLTLPVTLA